ncbi:DUF3014 domain-containing protein [Thiomonas sp.]|jgi:hypothetical protein|uniref:DUF3014 domain-containing protein n=1 Tax=Thiomonas sp. TaxID=2047785 RepID=UPI00261339B5|nr:DUF3014 domain-containing protein [Thiomonas sp.]
MRRLDGVEIGALIILLAGIVLALLHWESVQRMIGYVMHEPVPASAPAAPAAPKVSASIASAPASQPAAQVLQVPAASTPLPSLHASDQAFGHAVDSLVGRKAFAQWWVPDHLILHIVSTIDNLGRAQAPVRAWPVRPTPGQLLVRKQGSGLALDPANAGRYGPYMAMVRAVDPSRLVAVYVRFYPLFQDAWRELGYPKGQFNDRLLQVIDNLLAAPEPSGDIQLVQPHVLYQYADPALESATAGQKILMRIGPANEREVKTRLRELRAQLLLRMRPASGASQAH